MNKRNKTGITLIALIITIIVLLILAGVTISLVVGDNGILTKSQQAKNESEISGIHEQISLAAANGETEYYANDTDRITAYKNALISGVEGIDASSLTDNGSDLITGTVNAQNGKQYDFSIQVPSKKITLVEHHEEPPVVLENAITSDDYGKPVNYSVTVNGTVLDNWKVFLNDNGNVYLIYGDYLEASLAPDDSRISKDIDNYMYSIWSKNGQPYDVREYLWNNAIWSSFAAGVPGATATGSPTLTQLNRSLGRDNEYSVASISGINELYLPKNEIFSQCYGYWLSTVDTQSNSDFLYYVDYTGNIWKNEDAYSRAYCARPLIKLPADITGTIGTTVTIK